MKKYLCISHSLDGWRNLAADEWLLDHLEPDAAALYFYVNENAVVIGKNQNPWRECDLGAMERDGVQLVRRVTGGGAVFHDAGNLNFSFIADKALYDERAQLECIVQAVRSFGIDCAFSGRNDLLAGGRKFSGNAFCSRGNNRQHHGTLLVDASLDRLQRYLQPDEKKLRAKGVASVRSRVCNLKEFCPALTADALRDAVAEAFGPCEVLVPDESGDLARYEEKHRSWEWRLGKTPRFDLELEERFAWGGVQLLLRLEQGRLAGLDVYSDALDETLPAKLRKKLLGLRLDDAAAALRGEDPRMNELAAWLAEAL